MDKVNIGTKKDSPEKLAEVEIKGIEYFILASEFNSIVIALNKNANEFNTYKTQKFLTENDQKLALQTQLETIYTTLVGNNGGSLTSLATENKQNLIVAINEVNSLVKAVDLTKIINDELENSSEKTYSIDRIKALINELDFTQVIDDNLTSGVDKTYSIDGIKNFVSSEISKLIGAAPEALNTLQELAAELQENDTVLEQILSAQAKRLRVDDSQAFTEVEKTQGRTNLDVYSKTEVNTEIENQLESYVKRDFSNLTPDQWQTLRLKIDPNANGQGISVFYSDDIAIEKNKTIQTAIYGNGFELLTTTSRFFLIHEGSEYQDATINYTVISDTKVALTINVEGTIADGYYALGMDVGIFTENTISNVVFKVVDSVTSNIITSFESVYLQEPTNTPFTMNSAGTGFQLIPLVTSPQVSGWNTAVYGDFTIAKDTDFQLSGDFRTYRVVTYADIKERSGFAMVKAEPENNTLLSDAILGILFRANNYSYGAELKEGVIGQSTSIPYTKMDKGLSFVITRVDGYITLLLKSGASVLISSNIYYTEALKWKLMHSYYNLSRPTTDVNNLTLKTY